MKSIKKNNKGFTLIELLAVIVILGVLMIIAVPMVSKYITSAKQNAFISTAKAYVSSARYMYLNGDFDCGAVNIDAGGSEAILINFRQIEVDKTGGNSSFGKKINLDKSYVIIKANSNGSYKYYVNMVDGENDTTTGNGMSGGYAYNEDNIPKNVIKINSVNVNAMGNFENVSVGVGIGPFYVYDDGGINQVILDIAYKCKKNS